MNESTDRFARRWILVATIYFIGAVGLGVVMGASHDFRLRGVHVHLNMLGWVSMALTGFTYRAFPQAAATWLARWHFRLYQAALPVMMAGLAGTLMGVPAIAPLVGVGSTGVLLAVVLFVLAVWRHAGPSALHLRQPQGAL